MVVRLCDFICVNILIFVSEVQHDPNRKNPSEVRRERDAEMTTAHMLYAGEGDLEEAKRKFGRSTEANKTIKDLPPEILLEILSYLLYTDKFCKVRGVCRSFWPLINELDTCTTYFGVNLTKEGKVGIHKRFRPHRPVSQRKFGALPVNRKIALDIGTEFTIITVPFMEQMTNLLGAKIRFSRVYITFYKQQGMSCLEQYLILPFIFSTISDF
uniref:F-box domain-containing protein n=1 Tax=Steinernema glaseri TaxID=37863 RepID=A0A1I7Z6E1_9BILA